MALISEAVGFQTWQCLQNISYFSHKNCTLLSFHNEMDFKKRIFRTSTPPNCIFLEEGGYCAIIANYMQTSLN